MANRILGVEVKIFTFGGVGAQRATKTLKIGHFERIEFSPFQLVPQVALVPNALVYPIYIKI